MQSALLLNLLSDRKITMGMSINIVACTGIENTGRKVQRTDYQPDERFENFRTIRKNADEVDRCSDLKENYIYTFEDFTWFKVAYRERGYNEWRNKLAKLVGFNRQNNDYLPGPFRELLWPMDYDTTLGPETVVKLSLDFYIWRPRAERLGDAEFMETYNLFVEILDYASLNGAFWHEAS
jgi:hypothetical protein